MITSRLLQALSEHAQKRAAYPAVETLQSTLDYASLHTQVQELSGWLRSKSCHSLALLLDNSPSVVIADLAAIDANCVCIPLPLFFSPQQKLHVLRQAAVDTLLTTQPDAVEALFAQGGLQAECIELCHSTPLYAFRINAQKSPALPADCCKITFTSGSTGEPKGVCLSLQAMETVAASLCQAAEATAQERHLSMLPFATLLENIGGLYTTILNGSTLIIPPLADCGLHGSSSLNIAQFMHAFQRARASSCILIPQMLQALLAAIHAGMPKPEALRYVAVGGAPLAPSLLQQAQSLSVPVFEGYGLSEACSVVAVNTPQAQRDGSVGKPLPHVRLEFAEDGEILVDGIHYLGYLGETACDAKQVLATGDIGYQDSDGFLYIQGRKKHIFISSFGRNISPEWVERELLLETEIAQACVFGEAKPFLSAVLVSNASEEALGTAIERANTHLPDYAQVHRWVRASQPFSVANGQWTGTSRPRREMIEQAYRKQLDGLYDQEV